MAVVQYCLIKQAEGAEGTRWRSAWSKDPNSRPSFYVICEELMLLECSLATGMFAFFALHQVVEAIPIANTHSTRSAQSCPSPSQQSTVMRMSSP
jgi:hypothetical protein